MVVVAPGPPFVESDAVDNGARPTAPWRASARLRQRFDEDARALIPLLDTASVTFLSRSEAPITAMSTGHVALDMDEDTASDEEIIALYKDHATAEQCHSAFKTDLDIERLPSGKFDTNDLVLAHATLAHNTQRGLGKP